MKPFEYYSTPQIPFPKKLDYITYYVYDKGKVLWSGPYCEKTKSELKEEYPNAIIQEVLNEEAYRTKSKKYGEEVHKLHDEFMNDLFEDFGVQDNPKRHKAFELAYDRGHANGYSEVYNEFDELVELIRD